MEICGKEIRVRGRLIRIGYLEGEGYQFLDNPEAALRELGNSDARIDLFTFTQRLSDLSPRYGYPMERDNVAAVPVSTFDCWWTKQVDNKTRNMVRKAEKKGVALREVAFDNSLVRKIWEIYNETPIRQGRRFPHYGEDLETVRRVSATFLDRSVFIGAFIEENLIGFVKLVSDENGTQAGLMHILSRVDQRDKAPTNALIAQAVRSCAQRGVQYLWYANFSYGKKQHDSLAEFKRRNAFEKIEIPRYYVPLTAAGRGALALGLHHKLSERIPESLAASYRRFRSRWYASRYSGVESA